MTNTIKKIFHRHTTSDQGDKDVAAIVNFLKREQDSLMPNRAKLVDVLEIINNENKYLISEDNKGRHHLPSLINKFYQFMQLPNKSIIAPLAVVIIVAVALLTYVQYIPQEKPGATPADQTNINDNVSFVPSQPETFIGDDADNLINDIIALAEAENTSASLNESELDIINDDQDLINNYLQLYDENSI